jgi:two-component system repressor protein LuxO
MRPVDGRPADVSSRPRTVGVVIVDADPGQRRSLAGMIAERGEGRFTATVCSNCEEARAAVLARPGTIVLADLDTIGGASHLPDMGIGSTTIATSANASLTTAIAAMKGGAIDFLPKPIGAKALIERLESAVAGWRPEAPLPSASPAPHRGTDFAGFIGRSAPMLAVYEQIRRMAPSRAPVFITGESGTGKELTAEAIHALACGTEKPFIAINCSAIPKDLMESEIFGHVRGAFTGASENRTGAAELADGGTLFLDEVTEMDLGLQAKLLRFVQTGSLRRVGGSETKRVDVRILSATNRDPFAEVATGRLRADLFYRLHVLPIHLLPLRERREDILPLADAFLGRFAAEEGRAFAGFEDEAVVMLRAHAWPGNVRQLANVIRRVVVLDDGIAVSAAMLAEPIRTTEAGTLSPAPSGGLPQGPVLPYQEQERAILKQAIAAFDGNIARAAAALEISPSTIYRKLQLWSGSVVAET